MLEFIEYRNWQGFTHGIILIQVTEHTFGVALYDPQKSVFYCDGRGLPVQADFSDDEFELVAIPIAGSGGYTVIKP